jgi:hypothetical protein
MIRTCSRGRAHAWALASAVTALAWTAAPSTAQPILTYGFTDLNSSFAPSTPGSGNLSIAAVSASTGDVTRLVPSTQSALFIQDFVSGPDPANVMVNLALTGISATSAAATGSFTLTDVDGDTITGNLAGTLSPLGSNTQFLGLVSNVFLNETGDGSFEGTSGSFSMNFSGVASEPFNGATNYLISTPFASFGATFATASTQIQAQIVPEPATATLLGAAALLLRRRRA